MILETPAMGLGFMNHAHDGNPDSPPTADTLRATPCRQTTPHPTYIWDFRNHNRHKHNLRTNVECFLYESFL